MSDLAPALLAEIYADPDDDGRRSVYADYLIERGDPRGTFIALQLARVRTQDPTPSAEEQALLDAHGHAWLATRTGHPTFERGFWATLQASYDDVPDADLTSPMWGTVHRLEVGLQLEPKLPALLAATARSLRTIFVPSRAALAHVAASGLRIEELVLMFDLSRDPPQLAPVTALPALRCLGIHCEAEFAVRWLERANDIGIRDLRLQVRPHVDYLRKILRRAKRTQITQLAIAFWYGLVIHAARDSDGTLAIRSIALPVDDTPPVQHLDEARRWLTELHAHVDPGAKVTMPVITPALAAYADARGLRLVQRATSFAARPRFTA